MDAEHYVDLAMDAYNRGELEKEIELLTKAEIVNGGKFPNASLLKGIALCNRYERHGNLHDLDLAIASFTKAETDNGGSFPLASLAKGNNLLHRYERYGNLQDLDLAIASYTKAETDNDGKYPDASFNKGNAVRNRYERHGNIHDLDLAITSYTKAETDNGGKFPNASYNKGLTFQDLYKRNENPVDLESAIASYTKAESDNGGKFPLASFNKGNALRNRYERNGNLYDLDLAIASYTKAESDNGGKYPDASCNKGVVLHDRYERNDNPADLELAIASYTKAETDNGGKYPSASGNKGNALRDRYKRNDNLVDLESAIASYTKAETDNGGKYPRASGNKGNALRDRYKRNDNLVDLESAIASYTKAETDNGGKDPHASFNKGIIYKYDTKETDKAIVSFSKAIQDSENHFYPKAHLELSQIYLKYDEEKSIYHAFRALEQDNEDIKIVSFIEENFSGSHTKTFYENRLDYLSFQLFKMVSNEDNSQFEKVLQKHGEHKFDHADAFCGVLLLEAVELPVRVSYKEKLRLAYLIYYFQSQPEKTYYILKHLFKENELETMDAYFYMVSAYMIGEPLNVLRNFSRIKINRPGAFTNAFNLFSSEIKQAISSNARYDNYLLQINQKHIYPLDVNVEEVSAHKWIKDALNRFIRNPGENYIPPLSEKEIKGIYTRFVFEKIQKIVEESKSPKWKNFIGSLPNKNTRFDIEQLVLNIRETLKDNVHFSALIMTIDLAIRDTDSDNEILKRQLGLAIYAVLYSHHTEVLKRSGNVNPENLLVEYSKDFFYNAVLSDIVEKMLQGAGVLFPLLVGTGISMGYGALFLAGYKVMKGIRKKNQQMTIESFFKDLIEEAEAIRNT